MSNNQSVINVTQQLPAQLKPIPNQNTVVRQSLSQPVKRIYMHTRAIIRLMAAGQMLLTGSKDGTARIWNLSEQQFKTSLHTYRAPCQLVEVNTFLQSHCVVLGGKDRKIYIYDLESSQSNLQEYAEVAQIDEGILRMANSNETSAQMQDQITSIAEL